MSSLDQSLVHALSHSAYVMHINYHLQGPPMWHLLVFGVALAFFHGSEFVLAALYMRNQLSLRSFLLSWPYAIAMCSGLVEYALEYALVPVLKQLHAVSYIGLSMIVLGELLRKTAMVTAASNFTHDIQRQKRDEHVLVTTGIYRFVRHPGYLGWLIWSVGTQVLLANPICAVVFAYVAWRFFNERIQYEDWTLRQFFGQEYLQYARSTPSGIPFIP